MLDFIGVKQLGFPSAPDLIDMLITRIKLALHKPTHVPICVCYQPLVLKHSHLNTTIRFFKFVW